jgi:hypothetical protein
MDSVIPPAKPRADRFFPWQQYPMNFVGKANCWHLKQRPLKTRKNKKKKIREPMPKTQGATGNYSG